MATTQPLVLVAAVVAGWRGGAGCYAIGAGSNTGTAPSLRPTARPFAARPLRTAPLRDCRPAPSLAAYRAFNLNGHGSPRLLHLETIQASTKASLVSSPCGLKPVRPPRHWQEPHRPRLQAPIPFAHHLVSLVDGRGGPLRSSSLNRKAPSASRVRSSFYPSSYRPFHALSQGQPTRYPVNGSCAATSERYFSPIPRVLCAGCNRMALQRDARPRAS